MCNSCEPRDCSPPGSSVHGIFQARVPEWVAISSSRRSSWHRDRTHVPCIGRWVLHHLSRLINSLPAKSFQSCPTLCNPIDGSPPGSPVPGILQARTLQWVAISFSNAWNRKVKVKSLSLVQLLATPWTAAHQAPLSMVFSRQEFWSGVPLINSSSSYLLSGNHISGILWKSFTFVAEEVVTTQHLIWSTFSSFLIIKQTQNSLVAQGLKTHLPVQGTCVRSLVQEDATCCGATKPVHHNYWGPHTPKSCPSTRQQLPLTARGKPTCSNEDSAQP